MKIQRSSNGKNWNNTSEDWLIRTLEHHGIDVKKFLTKLKRSKSKIFTPLGENSVNIRMVKEDK